MLISKRADFELLYSWWSIEPLDLAKMYFLCILRNWNSRKFDVSLIKKLILTNEIIIENYSLRWWNRPNKLKKLTTIQYDFVIIIIIRLKTNEVVFSSFYCYFFLNSSIVGWTLLFINLAMYSGCGSFSLLCLRFLCLGDSPINLSCLLRMVCTIGSCLVFL